MSNQEHTIIPLSKRKLLLLILAGIAFVLAGVWLFSAAEAVAASRGWSPGFVQTVGVVCMLFFGPIGGFLAWKMRDQKPGLIVGPEGIIDNSSGLSAGLIPWEDIEGFSVLNMSGQRMLLVHVRNPQEYIDAQSSTFVRKMMTVNWKAYKSPISISAVSLKCSFDELHTLLQNGLNQYSPPARP